MKNVIATEMKPIKLWLDDIGDSAMAQARNLANLPFTYKYVVTIHAHGGNVIEKFTGYGEKGVRAETVAKRAAGRFVTSGLSSHTRTNIEVVEQFCPCTFDKPCQ